MAVDKAHVLACCHASAYVHATWSMRGKTWSVFSKQHVLSSPNALIFHLITLSSYLYVLICLYFSSVGLCAFYFMVGDVVQFRACNFVIESRSSIFT